MSLKYFHCLLFVGKCFPSLLFLIYYTTRYFIIIIYLFPINLSATPCLVQFILSVTPNLCNSFWVWHTDICNSFRLPNFILQWLSLFYQKRIWSEVCWYLSFIIFFKNQASWVFYHNKHKKNVFPFRIDLRKCNNLCVPQMFYCYENCRVKKIQFVNILF